MASPFSLERFRGLKGLFRKPKHAFDGPRGFCLGFHSISDTPISSIGRPGVVTSPADFRSLIEEAARMAEPVSLAESRFPDAWFAVTFDDGFADNLTEALPILEELGIPATVSPTVGFIEREVIPYEVVLARALNADPAGVSRSLSANAINGDKIAAYEAIRKEYKFRSWKDRAELVANLGLDDRARQSVFDLYLTKAQLKELSQHPRITIGSHGMSHICMSCVPAEVARVEMEHSKQYIEDLTRVPCEIFVLPYGDPVNSRNSCVKRAGYRRVVTTKPALNLGSTPSTIDRFLCDGLSVLGCDWNTMVDTARR
ncbi:hypothetical protein CKO31_14275 [Thiohalocapsa halophila]|uniref:NodB homology domain-containing protein n=1 Tax=Thiohalocapsa halophila TaxID=69359 RepID=A0ABS1CIY0_9GAMM|nr:polysaccharide deacetylase family protein [Thiohalocapsa halophila]MBK1631880.1 hypothetical protein [Thiohalocapsa halophila]